MDSRNEADPQHPAGSRFTAEQYAERIAVPFEYPVHFTRRVFHPRNDLLARTMDRLGEDRRHRALVYVDSGVAEATPTLLNQIKEYFHARPDDLELAAPPQTVPGGEEAKNAWDTVRDILWTAGNLHMDRQSYILAVGGGSVLDMVGFAASIIHRGLRLIRVPTTTLAQNDAGVGVKNGMNEHGQKNFVGTFAPPFAVLNDVDFLETLDQRDWIGGVAEAFKVATIRDAGFFEFLTRRARDLAGRDTETMAECVRRCAILHLEHIRTSGDPFEFGSARPLDFGHWAGHKLEILSGYRMGHGQAVAVGIALDAYYAMRQGLLNGDELTRLLTAMETCGLPTWSRLLDGRDAEGMPRVLEGLEQFREHLGGKLTVTLPDGIGRAIEVHHIDTGTVLDGITYLKQRADSRA
ncbi:MAG: 3-dehydroquinate synthase [Phycisphaerae bacterium]